MVAKISTGGNMFGALAYNQNKVDSEEAKVLFSNRMLLSEDGHFSIGECMRSFEMQMPVQLSTKKPILHISINPHPEDVLTDQQLSDIAREYMQKLGYGDQPYLVYKHTDIDRHHIHIVGLRVDENGRPLNDKFEHRRSKQITRELEQKYNLHPAERKTRTERPELKKVDYTAGDVKHQIGNTVKAACYGGYRFQSFGEYKALLATYNICAEEVKGEVNGKPYQGIVYSAMNDKGEKVGNPVKASRIGKSVGYEAVQRRMEKSGELIKNGKLKERTRKIVATTAMQTARSRRELEQQLRKQGIDVVFRQNDSGRIYGVTFIDYDSRVVLNGSRLGKEYSANVFNERFSGETGKMHQPEVSAPQQDQSTHQEQPEFTPKSDIVSGVASVLGAFGGLLGGGGCGGGRSRRTPPAKRERRKRSAQGVLTNLKTYNYAARR
ncbi:Putative conjugative transposon mobilization protein BF0132 [Bacteroides xylanisolvens SD CC 1b]|uniref:Conjugative transposon mobilization protein BF0132 n=2 Tax=Pseudomonadati TaxID=3379134 RepID=W6PAJ0_9BACE|nr:Putative conjugative transposon mobilization protein BF0132 [Bacteroides xylanisolvens SD CC 1b]